MGCQTWTLKVTVAGQGPPRAREVEAVVREEVVREKVQHPDPVAPVEIMLMIIGPVNTAPLQIPSQQLFVRCASNVGRSHLICNFIRQDGNLRFCQLSLL